MREPALFRSLDFADGRAERRQHGFHSLRSFRFDLRLMLPLSGLESVDFGLLADSLGLLLRFGQDFGRFLAHLLDIGFAVARHIVEIERRGPRALRVVGRFDDRCHSSVVP